MRRAFQQDFIERRETIFRLVRYSTVTIAILPLPPAVVIPPGVVATVQRACFFLGGNFLGRTATIRIANSLVMDVPLISFRDIAQINRRELMA